MSETQTSERATSDSSSQPQRQATDYLLPETLSHIAGVEMRARMIVEGFMSGMHRSPYQGFSVEFAQHRQYAPGDDLRHLDWKVFGRTDKLYLKQYQQETTLDLVLLVDASGSMSYGSGYVDDQKGGSRRSSLSWRKYDHAASLAAAMAYIALRQQDRVGLALFDDHLSQFVRPSNAKDHWRAIVDALIHEPVELPKRNRDGGVDHARKTHLGKLFEQVAARFSQRSLIVLISDLFDDTSALEQGLARLYHRRHDVLVLQVLDHAELTFPFRSPSEFYGLENEGKLRLDPPALRKAYLESINEHLRAVEDIARKFRFDHLVLDSSQNLGGPLSEMLARRERAIGKTR